MQKRYVIGECGFTIERYHYRFKFSQENLRKKVVDVDEGDPIYRLHEAGRGSPNFAPGLKKTSEGSSIRIKWTDLKVRPASWGPQTQLEKARMTWLSCDRTKQALGIFINGTFRMSQHCLGPP